MQPLISVLPVLLAFAGGWFFAGSYVLLGLSGAAVGVVWPFIAMPFMRTARDLRIPAHRRVEFAPGPASVVLVIGAAACVWAEWRMASTDLLSRMSLGMGSMMAFLMAFGATALLISAALVFRRG